MGAEPNDLFRIPPASTWTTARGWPTDDRSAVSQTEPCHRGHLPVTVVSADQEGGAADHRCAALVTATGSVPAAVTRLSAG